MKKLLTACAMFVLIVAAFWCGMKIQARTERARGEEERRDQAMREAQSQAEQDKREMQAKVHTLRLRYLGSDDEPDQPPTASELAFFQACADEELIKNRMQQASLEYESQWGKWDDDKLEPSDPVLRRAKKAAHDVAMAAQADEIKALQKRIEAMKAYAAERGMKVPATTNSD